MGFRWSGVQIPPARPNIAFHRSANRADLRRHKPITPCRDRSLASPAVASESAPYVRLYFLDTSMWRAIIPSAATLVFAAMAGASSSSATVTTSGRWMRPVGQELGVCEGGLAAWGWNYSHDRERDLVRI